MTGSTEQAAYSGSIDLTFTSTDPTCGDEEFQKMVTVTPFTTTAGEVRGWGACLRAAARPVSPCVSWTYDKQRKEEKTINMFWHKHENQCSCLVRGAGTHTPAAPPQAPPPMPPTPPIP